MVGFASCKPADALVLIFAVLELWLLQLQTDLLQFFLYNVYLYRSTRTATIVDHQNNGRYQSVD